MKMNAYT